MTDDDWWRSAVIYQVYVRSFFDANGDGVGDLAGVRAKLGYLRDLGVDAIWFNPWYPSPMADGGYDIADYRSIEPAFGTLSEAENLIKAALDEGIRTIIDVVPNHVSNRHPWFIAALAAAPGSPERARFWFHPGRGDDGAQMPTAWVSSFSGESWTRTINPDGSPGEWYLHLFTPQQPDLNWQNPEVWAEHEEILRFWFDRGVAGIRIDSAAMPVKDPTLPELPVRPEPGQHPHLDRDELHDIYRVWRSIADSYSTTDSDSRVVNYPGARVLVGEIWLDDAERFARYLRPDEMHTAFNFDFMARPWEAKELRSSIEQTLAAHAPVGAPATWVLSNHDVTRPVTRYGRADSSFAFSTKRAGVPTDLSVGTRRARAASLLAAALPGSLYIYQGDELGLPEVEDLPLELLQDPMHYRSDGIDPGRDGCRVPLPWHAQGRWLGFSPDDSVSEPWLPQPRDWGGLSVEAELMDDGSMLQLYRATLRLRRQEIQLHDGPLTWLAAGDDVLAFTRGEHFASITNLSSEPMSLPAHSDILLASSEIQNGLLPTDSTAWLRLSPEPLDPTRSDSDVFPKDRDLGRGRPHRT